MRIDFDETVPVPPVVVFDYLRSPTEWPRLYGAFGQVRDLGGGWYAVPLAGAPADLEARMTALEPTRRAAWELRGTFSGKGEVNLAPQDGGTRITGFEEIAVAGLDDPGTLAEATRRFEAIWQMGWDRLRSIDDS
jgi:hypothetical protein